MKRKVITEIEVEDGIDDGEVQYAVQKVFNQIEQFDGFKDAQVVGVERPNEEPQEARALYELLEQIDADDRTFAEKLEEAQEMAWRMAKDNEFMEAGDNE